MKLVYAVALLLCIPFFCISQSRIDSLKTKAEIAKRNGDKVKVSDCLSTIGWEFYSTNQYDSALIYYYQSLANSRIEPVLTASTLLSMGVVYNHKGYPDSCITYYTQALSLYYELKDTANVLHAEDNLSIIYKNNGLYEEALEIAFNTLSKLEKRKPDRALASCYNTIGSVYAKIKDYDNALTYLQKALNVRLLIDYTKGVAQSYNNIGELYSSMHQYDSALSNLFKAVSIKEKIKDIHGLGNTYNSIGEAYLSLNQVTNASSYFQKSLAIKRESGERLEQAIVLNNLGKLGIVTKDYKHAEAYIQAAEDLIRKTGALDELRKNLELKVKLYKLSGDPVKALRYAEELVTIKDSLLTTEKAQSLLSMQMRYEMEKKEQQINILQQDKALHLAEISSKRNWIQSLVITITLVSVIGILMFYGYRASQRNKKKVETLLKELHHRVKNNLQVLASVLSLQSQELTDANAIKLIKGSEGRVNAMALIHKKLYGDEENRTINMKAYVDELVNYLVHTYDFTHQNLALDIQSEEVHLDVDKAIPVGLILNEILTNALKYAFIDHKKPALGIELKIQNAELVILVRDNGPGLTNASQYETPNSFGLKMVNTLIKELKGKLSVINLNGTTFVLQIPS